jgi:Domain of unknown function (DUF4157)
LRYLMSTERVIHEERKSRPVRRKVEGASLRFDEVPGESEAELVRDAFLSRAIASPRGIVSVIRRANPDTRGRVVARLQSLGGNACVRRAVVRDRGVRGLLVGRSQPEMVAEVVGRKGQGRPLSADTLTVMEGFFGQGLGHVRVHNDEPASQLSRELNARAFTVGPDIFFAPGEYLPSTREGQGLLAHELTHALQQSSPGTSASSSSVQREALEEEPGDIPAPTPAPMTDDEQAAD